MAGRRIDDHKSWAGAPEKGGVFPDGSHKLKEYHSAEGSGKLDDQMEDTSEGIHRDQMHGDSKVKSHKMKAGYRY